MISEYRNMFEMIDASTFLKMSQETNLLRISNYENETLDSATSKTIIFEGLKSILKHKLDRCRFRSNSDGCSISVPLDFNVIEMRVFARNMRTISAVPELVRFKHALNDPVRYVSDFVNFTFDSLNAETFDDRILFYIKFKQHHFYNSRSAFRAMCQIIIFMDALKAKYTEFENTIRPSYLEHVQEVEREIREREERQRLVREREEAEERQRFEERRRREAEERERYAEEQRRLDEEQRRLYEEQNAANQHLRAIGASDGGIEIARRLEALWANN